MAYTITHYTEHFIDPNLRRPWTFLEEKLMLFAEKHPSFRENWVFSRRFQIFWPVFLVSFVAKHLVAAGYLTCKYEPDLNDYEDDEDNYYSSSDYKYYITGKGYTILNDRRNHVRT